MSKRELEHKKKELDEAETASPRSRIQSARTQKEKAAPCKPPAEKEGRVEPQEFEQPRCVSRR
jgi:hypothetical protein